MLPGHVLGGLSEIVSELGSAPLEGDDDGRAFFIDRLVELLHHREFIDVHGEHRKAHHPFVREQVGPAVP